MQQIIFIHIPKTAGMSLAHTFRDNNVLLKKAGKNTGFNYGFVHKYARDIIRPEDMHHPTVAVVRNPFDRIYSIFEFYQKKRDDIPKHLTFEEFVLSFRSKFLNKGHQFTECFEYVCDASRQNIMVSDILIFETLEQDFNKLSHKYEFFATLQSINKNESKQIKIDKKTLFSKEMKEEIESVFSRDLEKFNYTYEQFLATELK